MGLFRNLIMWQNYVHYVLLTIGLFIAHALPWSSTLEQNIVASTVWYISWKWYIVLFFYYVVSFFIIDTLVHLIFYLLPEPYRWRD